MGALSRSEAEDLLYLEARILDEGRYLDWLGMFSDDATYWMPCNGDGTDPDHEVSLIFDNLAKLRNRVDRLTSGLAHAQFPPSKTKRLISNVCLEDVTDKAATVSSGFILYELRRSNERIFAGRYEHRLSLVAGRWKISAKKVVLVNNDEVIDNLTFIV